ncbi:beclin-1 [Tetranychus urticae]|uniref:Beclin-1 n=2 Tax=Tetranychus urticae TaxID=32264 RepID=T1KGX9_TETUR|nr:beclin-1 [Tetranychus urticae]
MEASSSNRSYFCKNCSQPLIIHSSLSQIDGSTLSELSGNLDLDGHIATTGELSQTGDSEYDDNSSGLEEHQSASNSFLIIGDSMLETKSHDLAIREMFDMGHDMRITSKLFDILSDKSIVDHPLCEDCADSLIDKMDQKLKTLEEECKVYRECLGKLEKKTKNDNPESNLEHLQQRVIQLQLEEKRLIEELTKVEAQKKKFDEKIQAQEAEINVLLEEKDKFKREHNYLKKTLFEIDDERLNVENSKKYITRHLDILRKTNVFNATFHIWYSGHFGTINGFRLGRLPNHPVDWTEINAAWGQTTLLLFALARKINLTFERYRLVPYGNHSFIETLEDKPKELPLYGSGGFRYLLNNKFDQAMIAFLDCMSQVVAEIERVDKSWYCPYRMDKEKIEDTKRNNCYSIRIQYNSEEEWTKALKYMLTNLKWILTWVARPETSERCDSSVSTTK